MSVLALFASCGNEVDKETTSEVDIALDFPKKENLVNLSDIADRVSFIPLTTNDSCRIGSVDKLIVTEKYFVVVDKSLAASVFVFDKSGRFINRIGDRGHSKKEYLRLEDVVIDGNNAYVLDTKGKKIINYDMAGNYLESYPFAYTAYFFSHVSGDLFAFSCEYSKNHELADGGKLPNFFLYDLKKGKIVDSDLFFDSSVSNDALPVSLNNLNPYLYYPFGDVVYNVEEDGLSPFVHIIYPQESAAQIEKYKEMVARKKMTNVDLDGFLGKMPRLVTFFDCTDLFFAFVVNEGFLYYNFYYPETGKLLQAVGNKGLPIVDDLHKSLVIMPQAAFKGNLYYAEDIRNIPVGQVAGKVAGDENPVIVELHMRK